MVLVLFACFSCFATFSLASIGSSVGVVGFWAVGDFSSMFVPAPSNDPRNDPRIDPEPADKETLNTKINETAVLIFNDPRDRRRQ